MSFRAETRRAGSQGSVGEHRDKRMIYVTIGILVVLFLYSAVPCYWCPLHRLFSTRSASCVLIRSSASPAGRVSRRRNRVTRNIAGPMFSTSRKRR